MAVVLLLVSGCAGLRPMKAGSGPKVRVLLSRGTDTVELGGAEGRGAVVVRREPDGAVTVDGRERRPPVRFSAGPSPVHVNGRPHRGVILVYGDKTGLMVVNELPLETYVAGIVGAEVSPKWHAEALKAQAVVARTYALYRMRGREAGPYDLEGTVAGQVYKGVLAEDPATLMAVSDTSGEVLAYGNGPALTVYHSNAGGATEASRDVWLKDYPYLGSVESPYDSLSPGFSWVHTMTAEDLKASLNRSGYGIGAPVALYPVETTASGRVKTLLVRDSDGGTLRLSGEDLRKAIGYGLIRSTIFEVRALDGSMNRPEASPGASHGADAASASREASRGQTRNTGFTFSGRGSGHGVGLSQWGAKGMADNGRSYREILSHYYPGTSIERAY
jgi:stage II sporulation protein D